MGKYSLVFALGRSLESSISSLKLFVCNDIIAMKQSIYNSPFNQKTCNILRTPQQRAINYLNKDRKVQNSPNDKLMNMFTYFTVLHIYVSIRPSLPVSVPFVHLILFILEEDDSTEILSHKVISNVVVCRMQLRQLIYDIQYL